MNLSKFRAMVDDRGTWHAVVPGYIKRGVGYDLITEQQQSLGVELCR